jgi:hypothetical protein
MRERWSNVTSPNQGGDFNSTKWCGFISSSNFRRSYAYKEQALRQHSSNYHFCLGSEIDPCFDQNEVPSSKSNGMVSVKGPQRDDWFDKMMSKIPTWSIFKMNPNLCLFGTVNLVDEERVKSSRMNLLRIDSFVKSGFEESYKNRFAKPSFPQKG